MSKRRLSRRQAWRIEKIQDERRDRAHRRSELAEEALDTQDLGLEQLGVVAAHYGTQVAVEGVDEQGQRFSQRCHLRANLEELVTGDQVVWRPGSETGVVVARGTRHSALRRPDASGRLRAVAANIDQLILVVAPEPEAHANLIDRYLVAAEVNQIEPILLLNKTDLLKRGDHSRLLALVHNYEQLGYTVLRASSQQESELQTLRRTLDHKTSVFVGQSGVGKSSLVNALLPQAGARVGELSGYGNQKRKGKHTTTTAVLYHLPSGGELIDSPGIREFGLGHMQRDEIAEGFRELRPLLGCCRFRNCAHRQEPGCAWQEALAQGTISEARLASYFHLVDECGTD